MTEDPATWITPGEAYPEEVDGYLHERNRLAGEVANAALEARRRYQDAKSASWNRKSVGYVLVWRMVKAADRRYERTLDEYEKLISGGQELEAVTPPLADEGDRLAHEGMEALRAYFEVERTQPLIHCRSEVRDAYLKLCEISRQYQEARNE